MIEYTNVNVKLSDRQLKQLKTAWWKWSASWNIIDNKTKNKANLPYELLLTTRQKTRLRNAFNNNMPTDSKLSKAQIFKIIQSGGVLESLLSKLADPLI